MRLALITVNYNNAERTIALLESLKNQLEHDVRVYVVDNASEAEDKNTLESWIKSAQTSDISFIASAENNGFSAGNNLAIKQALAESVEWIACINNDTVVKEDFVTELLEKLSKIPPSIAGIPLKEGGRVAYAGLIKWFSITLPHIYSLAEARRLSGNIYAVGGGVAFHRSVVEKIGLWDERYFLYFEDADFSMRAKKAGFQVIPLEGPIIEHAGSASTKKLGNPMLLRYHARNNLLFAHVNGFNAVKTFLPFWVVILIIGQLIKIAFFRSKKEASQAILSGIFDYRAHRFGKLQP
ncbi:MAG: glycosyltransferase family 2 protein [Patescibacteria group bacterium]